MFQQNEMNMGYRINERNVGHWTIEGEPKKRKIFPKKVSRSFTAEEIRMFEYILCQVSDDIKLDASDINDQVFRDQGNILIQFSRDDMDQFRSLQEKFK